MFVLDIGYFLCFYPETREETLKPFYCEKHDAPFRYGCTWSRNYLIDSWLV